MGPSTLFHFIAVAKPQAQQMSFPGATRNLVPPPPAHASCLRGSSTCTPGPKFPASCSKPQETALHPHDGDGGTIFCFSPNFLFSANDTFFKILPPVNVCLKTRAVKSLRARRGHAPSKLLLQPEECFSFPRVLAENLQADGARAFPAE